MTPSENPSTSAAAPLGGRRWSLALAGLALTWLGLMAGVGLLAAPVLFALLDRALAGQVAGRLFALEAQGFTLLSVAMVLVVAAKAKRVAPAGQTPRMPTHLLWLLLALFCTVLGHHGLQPMMVKAKAGEATPLSFGQLHGISSSLFLVKALALSAFAWVQLRALSGRPQD